jgi:glycosyltransferase involved in cell wall biosynthesis
MEYMAAGLPVIASDQGDIPEIIGGAGVLVPPGDEQALAGALMRLLNDERHRKDLGLRARRRARAHTWDAVAERVEIVLMARALAA